MRRNTLFTSGGLVAGFGLMSVACASANDTPVPAAESRDPLVETGRESDHLTGDWNGFRTRLVDRGVHFQFGYLGETMSNLSGGLRGGTSYNGLGELAVELDLHKLNPAWPEFLFRASSLWLHGDSPTGKRIGDVQAASNIDAFDSVRLYELWVERAFLDGGLNLRAGLLLADAEFTGTEYGGVFLNSAFGWPHWVSANTVNTGPAFFVTAPGVRVRYDFNPATYVQAAVYDGDSFDDPAGGNPRKNAAGTRIHFSADQGTFSMYEAGYRHNQGADATGLPGRVKIGAWLHTGRFADPMVPGAAHNNNHGWYFAGEQMIWREVAEQGLGVFLRAGWSPDDRSAYEFAFDGGLNYTGLIPGRDADVLGLGIAYAQASAPVTADYEAVIELVYDFQVRPGFSVQPSLQQIINPGAPTRVPDATVFALRANLSF